MTLPLANLDNRQWLDLVEEGRALIPRYAPSWTDHNVHDPGITLMELLAWLTEMTIYRLNRVPERHRRKFLSLIGFKALTPQPAQAVLSFRPDEGADPFELPAGVEFEAINPEQQSILFRTLRDVTVSDVGLQAVQVHIDGSQTLFDRTREWLDGLPVAVMGPAPQPGVALYLGFSGLPLQGPTALALHFQGLGSGRGERARLLKETAARLAACRPILPDIICESEDGVFEQLPEVEPLHHHSARVVWEILTGTEPDQWTPMTPTSGMERPAVGQVMDDTRALSLDGVVEFNPPESAVEAALGEVSEALFYLRCRLAEGGYDAPPVLSEIVVNGVAAVQAVSVSQTFEIGAGITPVGSDPEPGEPIRLDLVVDETGSIQGITFLEADTAPDHPDILVLDYETPAPIGPGQIVLPIAMLGMGNGRPDQRMTLPQAPVHVESLQLYTHSDGSWFEWTRREDFDGSKRTDFHFVMKATTGEICFGNGERGRVVPTGVLILAVYRATRGAEGNVGAETAIRPAATRMNEALFSGLTDGERDQLSSITADCRPHSIGTDGETLAATTGRAVEILHAHQRLLDLCAETVCKSLDEADRDRVRDLRAPTRGVNLLDIERLALDVPGTRVRRARAWTASHPDYVCLQAPGTVTVVVVPDNPAAKPEPSPGLLSAVKQHLDRRRLITTRLEVVGPEYLEVRVEARVQAVSHTDVEKAHLRIVDALNAFLDPRNGGPEGRGWPFGRNVYRSEILQLIDEVPGVDHVLELSLRAGPDEAQCGNLTVCPTWLVTAGAHRITVVRGGYEP